MSGIVPPPSRDEDLALRDRCMTRPPDRRAWDELYRRFAPLVRGRILHGHRLFPDDEIEDAVQTVFLKLATGALDRYEGRSGLKSYLVTLADSVRITENRRRSAAKRGSGRTVSFEEAAGPDGEERMSVTAADGGAFPSSGARNPEEQFLEGRRSEQIHRAVARLSDPRDREVVSLYFGEEPCVDREIAERLGMPLNTVTWRRLKALRELRNHLDLEEQTP